jgi:hypothetical protein
MATTAARRRKTAAERQTAKKINKLRGQRVAIRSGHGLHWGTPWCDGIQSPYHQGPNCEGCCVRLFLAEQAAGIDAQIRALTDPAPKALEDELLSLIDGRWVLA